MKHHYHPCRGALPLDRGDAAAAGHELIPHGGAPQTHLHQVVEQVGVDNDELSGLHSTRVEIARVRLDALVESAAVE